MVSLFSPRLAESLIAGGGAPGEGVGCQCAATGVSLQLEAGCTELFCLCLGRG